MYETRRAAEANTDRRGRQTQTPERHTRSQRKVGQGQRELGKEDIGS